MGRPKLTLPLGNATVLDHVISAVREAGVAEVLVVAAPESAELVRRATAAGAQVLQLPEDTPDMRATCLCGLAWLEEHFHPAENDGWLLLPADHPTIQPDIVRAILAAARTNSIVVPTYHGKRGHPTWLRWSNIAAIRMMPAEHGLNAFIRSRGKETFELDWPNGEILRDLDTPEDYQRLLTELHSERVDWP